MVRISVKTKRISGRQRINRRLKCKSLKLLTDCDCVCMCVSVHIIVEMNACKSVGIIAQ